jgi:hypothetical protein
LVRQAISDICQLSGITLANGCLTLHVPQESELVDALLRLAQTALLVANLHDRLHLVCLSHPMDEKKSDEKLAPSFQENNLESERSVAQLLVMAQQGSRQMWYALTALAEEDPQIVQAIEQEFQVSQCLQSFDPQGGSDVLGVVGALHDSMNQLLEAVDGND